MPRSRAEYTRHHYQHLDCQASDTLIKSMSIVPLNSPVHSTWRISLIHPQVWYDTRTYSQGLPPVLCRRGVEKNVVLVLEAQGTERMCWMADHQAALMAISSTMGTVVQHVVYVVVPLCLLLPHPGRRIKLCFARARMLNGFDWFESCISC